MGFQENLDKLLEICGNPKEFPGPAKRDPELRKLEGKYTCKAHLKADVPVAIEQLLNWNNMGAENVLSGKTNTGQCLGKWLKKSHIPDDEISRLFNSVSPEKEIEL